MSHHHCHRRDRRRAASAATACCSQRVKKQKRDARDGWRVQKWKGGGEVGERVMWKGKGEKAI